MGEALLVEPVTAYTVTCAPCCFILLSKRMPEQTLLSACRGRNVCMRSFVLQLASTSNLNNECDKLGQVS